MNKEQIVSQIADKAVKVIQTYKIPDEKAEEVGIKKYIANAMFVKDGVANIKNIPFYVVDEGEETELAYWENAIPSEFSEVIEVVAEGEIINQ